MAVDPNIFQAFAQPVRSVTDIQNSLNQSDLAQSQIQQSRIGVRNALALQSQKDQLRQAVQSGEIDLTNPAHASRALSIAPDVAPALLKTVQEGQTSAAKMGLDNAQAGHATAQATGADLDNKAKAASQLAARVQTLQSPDDIASFYEQGVKDGLLSKDQALSAIDQVPYNDPAKFAQWKQQQFQASVPVVEKFKQDAEMARTKLQTDTSIRTTGMNNATSTANVATTQAGENARSAASHGVQLTIAGLNPDGTTKATPDGQVPQRVIDAAARFNLTGEMPANLGRGTQGAVEIRQIRDEASRQNQVSGLSPDQRAAQQLTGKRTLASFAPGGKDAVAIESGNTALNHLDTLKQLAAAQANGDIRLFNVIANKIATETGGAAPTNLQSAVVMVGPEISKAVVGTGGGVDDRKKVDNALGALTKGAPAQAAGTISTMQELFGGRLMEKQRSYERGSGLKDFTEPGRFLSPAAAAVLARRTAGAAPGAPKTVNFSDLKN